MHHDSYKLPNVGIKLSWKDSLNLVYNLDVAKSPHLLFGGFSISVQPMYASCLFALDTQRNCLEKEERKFSVGFPGQTKPCSSSAIFNVFTFREFRDERPGVDLTISAATKVEERMTAGLSVGIDSFLKLPSASAQATYIVDDETTISSSVSDNLRLGLGLTKRIDAYHTCSIFAFLDPIRGLSLGLTADYQPDPPMFLRIKYKLKELKFPILQYKESDALQFKLEEAEDIVRESVKKTGQELKRGYEEAKKSWEEWKK